MLGPQVLIADGLPVQTLIFFVSFFITVVANYYPGYPRSICSRLGGICIQSHNMQHGMILVHRSGSFRVGDKW